MKPKDQQNYLDLLDEHILNLHKDENLPQTLVGSFQVTFGTEDEVIHIWKYSGGYAALQKSEFNVEANLKYRGDFDLHCKHWEFIEFKNTEKKDASSCVLAKTNFLSSSITCQTRFQELATLHTKCEATN